MSTTPAIITAADTPPAVRPLENWDRNLDLGNEGTAKRYRAGWRAFVGWCDSRDIDPEAAGVTPVAVTAPANP